MALRLLDLLFRHVVSTATVVSVLAVIQRRIGEDAVPVQGCKVVVVGGGIGGMTAALLLGSVLLELPLPDFGHGLDHALVLRRSHLHGVLLAAVHAHPAITVRLGTQVRWVSPDGAVGTSHQGVEATSTADLVVGADGTASTVRGHGDFGAVARATGAWYVRALVPGVEDELGWGEYWTALGLLGGVPLGDGSTNLYLDATAPPVARALAARDLEEFRRRWAAALPLAASVLEGLGSVDALLVNQVTSRGRRGPRQSTGTVR
jgi:2-polyprenyl-6-methoxyphenol hydroxylase-like FAD-dependent oxidoreductase